MSQGTVFAAPPEKFSFPRQEEATQLYWDKIDAFKESLRRSEGRKLWTFYDGPPFATGLPHYGHILAGTIKDIVCRYAHQTGHHVERRAGWDCHGLPVEYEIDQKLGIKSREDVLAMGIDKYNDECRAIVMRYSSQWVSTVTRMGRWIDFENDYKTMNIEFMESVWWVFKQIYEKGLVYQGFKVMPYSTTCSTPLSNFEASQNYKEVSDPAVIVGFPIVGEPDGAMLCAWTTTPWTLPSNLALCVHPDWEYAKVKDAATGNHYVLLKSRLSALYPAGKQKKSKTPLYTLVSSIKGDELKGKAYLPPFDYFASYSERGCFRVLADRFVKDDSGTGIVHMAPAFGEEDNRICREAGLVKKDGEGIVCPIDANGRFTSDVPDFCGVYIKEADGKIMEALKARGRLVDKDSITHSYPFCWRSETPLIYRTIPSWFVNVERMKERLLANNEQTYWVPEFVQTKRFHNWLRDARDWAISRNRFWGTPLPIWASEDGEELVVVGSIAELQELSGRSDITDLHRQFIDDLTIPSKRGKGVLRRVDEVFDCWFESGAMPYAQAHYPFENKAKFEASFPADFIAEGLDQTRGWFYTLMVLSTCLFDKPAFKNLIVNGLVLAEDGLKMSKRLKNYPDPIYVINEYGADALRLYLINSPVVCADTLKFKESGVKGIIRDVFLPWYNSFRFFIQSATRLELDIGAAGRFVPDVQRAMSSPNAMDRWIIAAAHSLVAFVRAEMAAYRLYTAVPRILHFVEQLTNWYIKLNRTRLQRKGDDSSVDDCMRALCALYEVLLLVAKLMAPLTPFLADYFYTQLAAALPEAEREQSVHFCMLPDVNEGARDEAIERAVAAIQPVIELGRNIRLRRKKPLKVPLPELVVLHRDGTYLDDVKALERYVISELNVRAVSVRRFVDSADIVALKALPNHTVLGRRFGGAYGGWQAKVKALSHEQLCAFLETKTLTIDGEVFGADDVIVQSEFIGSTEVFEAAASDMKDLLVVLNCVPDQAMLDEGTSRNVSNRVQKLRKEAGLEVQDAIEVFYQVLSPAEAQPRLLAAGMHKSTDAGDEGQEAATAEDAAALDAVVAKMTGMVSKLIGKPFLPLSRKLPEAVVLVQALRDIDGVTIELVIARELAVVRKEALANGETAAHVQQLLAAYDPVLLKEKLAAEGGKLRFRLNGTEVELEHGTHFALSSLA